MLSFEEVANHNKIKDCWLIISGKVYDVTPFMDEHPGGGEVLLSATAKDATNDFEDIGHSDYARGLMEKYYIGEIDSTTVPDKRTYIPPQQTPFNPNAKASEFLIKILQFLVPLLILGLAVTFRQYTKIDVEYTEIDLLEFQEGNIDGSYDRTNNSGEADARLASESAGTGYYYQSTKGGMRGKGRLFLEGYQALVMRLRQHEEVVRQEGKPYILIQKEGHLIVRDDGRQEEGEGEATGSARDSRILVVVPNYAMD
ncbi:hypothetical protein V6N13_125521 [Hibiscus sabdariffa]